MTLEQWWKEKTPKEKEQIIAIISIYIQEITENNLSAQLQQAQEDLKKQLDPFDIPTKSLKEPEKAITQIQKLHQQELNLTPSPEPAPQHQITNNTFALEQDLMAMSAKDLRDHLLQQDGVSIDKVEKTSNGFNISGYQLNQGPKLDAKIIQPAPDAPIEITTRFQKPIDLENSPEEQLEEQADKQVSTIAQLASSINKKSGLQQTLLNIEAKEYEIPRLAKAYFKARKALQNYDLFNQFLQIQLNGQKIDDFSFSLDPQDIKDMLNSLGDSTPLHTCAQEEARKNQDILQNDYRTSLDVY
ncbi:hypothetical protein [Piscirickettsia litoralis]|uniref:Uncharacterized protein n=1 Tax=Piscirickettsia litoralis TaxID=1891921 RepID=A0ABX3A0J5_9GAMM|nr:hypothetical protein [Piscirickettsia litoralis]ODN42313.1 hypothetical protein BGC07_04410 [Piscirickettsia litoralis]